MNRTLVVLAVPLEAEQANDTLNDLSLHGLVEPTLLIDSSGNTTLLREGRRSAVSLEDHLAGQWLDRMRLVAVTVCGQDGTVAVKGIGETAARLRSKCATAGIRFQAISVVVPSHGSTAPSEAFFPDWEANLILAPEDAAGSRGMMAVTLSDDKVPHVAISAALTIGGAWTWQATTPMDSDDVQFVQGERRVSIARLAVRIVDAGGLTSKVIGWALDPAGIWPIPLNTVPNGDPQAVVNSLAAAVASAPEVAFTYRPAKPTVRPMPRRLPLRNAFSLFFSRLWVHLRALPGRKLRSARDTVLHRMEEFVQKETFGADSDIAIRIGNAPTGIDELTDTGERLRVLHSMRHVTVQSPLASPDTWTTCRSVAFGLIDGGNFAGSITGREPIWEGQRSVLEDRALIVASFDGMTGGFELSSDDAALLSLASQPGSRGRLGATDVAAARLLNDALTKAEERIRQEHPIEIKDGDQPKDSSAPATGEPENESEKENETRVRLLRARFDLWVDQRRNTLMWKLGEHLNTALTEAIDSLSTSASELQAIVTELATYDERERKLMTRLRRRTVLVSIILVLALASTVIGFFVFAVGLALLAVALLVVTLGSIGLGFLSTAREEVRFEHRLNELQTRPSELLEMCSNAANEVARLTHLNHQLSDWSDIYSHILHRPWGTAPDWERPEPWVAPTQILSFVSGSPDINSDLLHGEILQLRRQICAPRWLSTIYLELVSQWREHYSELAAIGDGDSVSPEGDAAVSSRPISTIPTTGESLYSPRLQFKNELIAGRYASALLASQVAELEIALADEDATKLVRIVHCDIPGLDSLGPEEFLGSLVSFSPLPDFNAYLRPLLPPIPSTVQRSIFGLSSAIQAIPPPDGVSRERTQVHDPAERFVLAAFRLDLSEPTSVENINLIDVASAPSSPGERLAPQPPTTGNDVL